MAAMKKFKHLRKISIWQLVGAIYGPLIFCFIVANLPNIEWKYAYESYKTKLSRDQKKAKSFGFPGIPYIPKTGTSTVIYINENDIAYGECGFNFYCLPQKLNSTVGNYRPVNPAITRIKKNVVKLDDRYYCNLYTLRPPGKCYSGGWKKGSER